MRAVGRRRVAQRSVGNVGKSKFSKTKIYDKGLGPEIKVDTAKPGIAISGNSLSPKMVESDEAQMHPKSEDALRDSLADDLAPRSNREMMYAMPEEDLSCFRLSLVGLQSTSSSCSNSSCRTSSCDEQRDELHSNRFSSVLEAARSQLVEALPQITEDMVSRAIIHAFASDKKNSRGRFCEHPFRDVYQEEVDQVWRAEKWLQKHRNETTKETVLSFLQECLNDVFLLIRNEDLVSPDQALRILLSVGAILRMQSQLSDPQGYCYTQESLHALYKKRHETSPSILWCCASRGNCN